MDPTTSGKWKDIAEIIALVGQVALQSQGWQARAFQACDNRMDMADNPKLDTLAGID